MGKAYSSEMNVQILIALMKAHGIKKVIASPGTTNLTFVGSIQNDPFFEIYSSAEERSAAYMACGMAAETGEPVAISCTGATASRNYFPALTEAYYRKLPILAITSTQYTSRIGHHVAQVIDRSCQPLDTVKMSVQIPTVKDADDEWACEVNINNALLELRHRGGGPVHINLTTTYSKDFTVKELPKVRVINRYTYNSSLPIINAGTVAIYIGTHMRIASDLQYMIDSFCKRFNGVVVCDHTSNYNGKYRVHPCLICGQKGYTASCRNVDLMIHIGEISGAAMDLQTKQTWRVNEDGVLRDTFKSLTAVFEMDEMTFFGKYIEEYSGKECNDSYLSLWNNEYKKLVNLLPDLPFSNPWIAKQISINLPKNSEIHFGILNSLRSWDYFEIPNNIDAYSNTGGFGIDGCVSSLIGASLCNENKLYFGVVGDLAFFYDMNSLGNRHIGHNIRLLIINNGKGTEFRNYNHPAARFGEDADWFMAAAGHYGSQSKELVKHYAQDLGFKYLSASNKDEFIMNIDEFISPEIKNQSIIFEVFTNSQDESDAIEKLQHIVTTTGNSVKQMAKGIIGENNFLKLKKVIKG